MSAKFLSVLLSKDVLELLLKSNLLWCPPDAEPALMLHLISRGLCPALQVWVTVAAKLNWDIVLLNTSGKDM